MPFSIENEIDLSKLETEIIEIIETKVRLKDDLNISTEEIGDDTEISTIAMITKKILKKELRCNRIDELYLTIIQEILLENKKGERISVISSENNKIPK